jgi:alcohol dehydrogenase
MLTPSGLSAMPMGRVIAWELDLLGSHGMAARDYPEMLAMVADGTLNPSVLITRVVDLNEGAIALKEMGASSPTGITVIHPSGMQSGVLH